MQRKRRTSRRRYSAKPKNNIPLMISAVSLIAVVIVSGVVGLSAAPAKRGADLCVHGAKPPTVVAVIVDASGEFSEVQQQAFLDRLQRAFAYLSAPDSSERLIASETRVDVYELATHVGQRLEPVFSMCAPAPLTGISAWVGNPRRIERDYQTRFEQRMLAVFQGLVGQPEADRSLILESITAASEQSFHGRLETDRQHLILVSDLLQHSPVISFYRSGVGEFRQFASEASYNSVRPDLKRATFCTIIIARTNPTENRLQSTALLRWWEEYAVANRGNFDPRCYREFQI